MGQKKLAVLTGDRINEGFLFLQENLWPFSRTATKSGRNNEVTLLFHCSLYCISRGTLTKGWEGEALLLIEERSLKRVKITSGSVPRSIPLTLFNRKGSPFYIP